MLWLVAKIIYNTSSSFLVNTKETECTGEKHSKLSNQLKNDLLYLLEVILNAVSESSSRYLQTLNFMTGLFIIHPRRVKQMS